MSQAHPVVIAFLNAWKALDENAYAALFADKFESIDPYGTATTEDGVRQHIHLIRKYWTDLHYEITEAFGDEHHAAVAYRIRMRGIGGGWEGQQLTLDCIALVEITDGRISRWREQFDTNVFAKARARAA